MFRMKLLYNVWHNKKINYKDGNHILCKSIFQPKAASDELFARMYGRKIDWDHPELLDEKLMILKCTEYYKNRLVEQCYDKVRVMDYVSKIHPEILIPTIHVYENVRQIRQDWKNLPDQFVIKYSKGCGTNVIVHDKQKFDVDEVCCRLHNFSKKVYGYESAEFQGLRGKGRFLCQEYIGQSQTLPVDYKYYCMNGKAKFVMVVEERGGVDPASKERKSLDYFLTPEFEKRGYTRHPSEIESYWAFRTIDEKQYDISHVIPKNKKQMKQIAEDLARDFKFVRVDLFEYQGKVLFSELTFTPFGCMQRALSDQAQRMFAHSLQL